jgi:hypothetical protein
MNAGDVHRAHQINELLAVLLDLSRDRAHQIPERAAFVPLSDLRREIASKHRSRKVIVQIHVYRPVSHRRITPRFALPAVRVCDVRRERNQRRANAWLLPAISHR